MELHDAVIYGFPYKLRPKPKIASTIATGVASYPGHTWPGYEATTGDKT